MKYLFHKSVLVLLLFSMGTLPVIAQKEREIPLTIETGVDIMSSYIWRGMDLGHTPSIQPYISASWKNFTVGTWSAFRITGDGTDEVDIFISQSIGPVTLTLFDYWSYSRLYPSKYLDLHPETTSHLFEAQILLSGGERIPLNLMGGYMFYGADPSKSLYFELEFVKPIKEGELKLFAGYQAMGSYYAGKSSFVSTGAGFSYPVKILEWLGMNIVSNLTYNPAADKVYFTIGIGFKN